MTATLTTGWEPDLPPGDSLLRQFVLDTADRAAGIASTLTGRAERDPDASLADLGSAVPFENIVVLLRPPAADSFGDLLDRAVRWFPPQRSWMLMSVFPVPAAQLVDRGFTLIGHPPVMLQPPLTTAPPPVPPGLDLRPVATPEDLEAFRQVLVRAFGLPDEPAAIADARLLGGPTRVFVGWVDGEPVTAAAVTASPGLATIEYVGTVPGAGRRGYGAAATWLARAQEPDLPAMLLASDPGQPVYERMGFVRLLRATLWIKTPTDPA